MGPGKILKGREGRGMRRVIAVGGDYEMGGEHCIFFSAFLGSTANLYETITERSSAGGEYSGNIKGKEN